MGYNWYPKSENGSDSLQCSGTIEENNWKYFYIYKQRTLRASDTSDFTQKQFQPQVYQTWTAKQAGILQCCQRLTKCVTSSENKQDHHPNVNSTGQGINSHFKPLRKPLLFLRSTAFQCPVITYTLHNTSWKEGLRECHSRWQRTKIRMLQSQKVNKEFISPLYPTWRKNTPIYC